MIHAIHFGLNKYPYGNALQKCVADARAMNRIFGGRMVLDRQAKPAEILGQLHETACAAGKDEWAVITYSGHGTPVPDEDGDEPDGQDEAIVAINLEPVIDDEIHEALRGRHRKARVLLIADSCYSGMIHRAIPVLAGRHAPALRRRRARYLPPALVRERKPTVQCQGKQDALPNIVVISGCTDFEFSYEGPKHGVLTGALIETYQPGLTIERWFMDTCLKIAASEFGSLQHPQLVCSRAARKWRVPEW